MYKCFIIIKFYIKYLIGKIIVDYKKIILSFIIKDTIILILKIMYSLRNNILSKNIYTYEISEWLFMIIKL